MKTEVFNTPESWRRYALPQLLLVERIATELSLEDRLHSWPDSSLGSKAAIAEQSDPQAYKNWLKERWERISEWPGKITNQPVAAGGPGPVVPATEEQPQQASAEKAGQDGSGSSVRPGELGKHPAPGVTPLVVHNAADILAGKFKLPVHIVSNMLRPGYAVGGGGKSAGKTALALDLAVAIATGGKALGYFDVVRGRVLYLALEQSLAEVHELLRLKGLSAADVGKIDILTAEDGELKPLDSGGLEQVERWIVSTNQPRMVVTDVLERWWATGGGYSKNYTALPRLHQLGIDRDVAILALHHTKKKHEREVVKEILGDTGIVGTSSSVLVLEPPDMSGKVRLAVTGRLPSNSYELEFNKLTLSFTCVGTWDGAAKTPERGAIIDMLKAAQPHPMTAAQILAEFHKLGCKAKTLDAVKVMLGEMTKDGETKRTGRGLYTIAKT